MRRWLPIVLLAALFGVFSTPASRVRAQNPADPDVPSYVNSHSFNIPFSADANRRIKKLYLWYSINGGQWQRSGEALPTQRGFQFKTGQDGNYTFAVQTSYETGQVDPAQADLRPNMRVVVDTVPPKITLRPFADAGGAAGVSWDVADENIDPASIQLLYRWPNATDWGNAVPGTSQLDVQGQHSWRFEPGKWMQVKMKAKDRAGNVGESQPVTVPPQPGDSAGDPGTPRPPARPNLFYVHSPHITLQYQVKAGPSGVAKVHLYYSKNRGDWKLAPAPRASARPAVRPPDDEIEPARPDRLPADKPKGETRDLTFDADADGLYGFIIVAESTVGLRENAPQRGDLPQVQVEVDTARPEVQITEVKVIPGGDRGNVLSIAWKAQDKNMAPQPIRIEYNVEKDAPQGWKPIAERLENDSGRYTWPVPQAEPYRFYVRVTAIDRAGNQGVSVWPQPVVVDLVKPQVDIIRVEPLDGAPRP